MALAVDQHPEKKRIINALLAGVSLRKLAATLDPPIHFSSLQRYKLQQVRPVARNAARLAKVLGNGKTITDEELADTTREIATEAIQARNVVDPYLARIAKHQETVDRSLSLAEADGDGRTVAALVGVDLKGLELDARLTGRLDAAAGGTTNIYVVSAAVSLNTTGRPTQVIDVKAGE